jgi:hypothetical protein
MSAYRLPIAAFRAQGRLRQLSANNGHLQGPGPLPLVCALVPSNRQDFRICSSAGLHYVPKRSRLIPRAEESSFDFALKPGTTDSRLERRHWRLVTLLEPT